MKEALKLALEALEFDGFTPEDQTHRAYTTKAITAIKEALAQSEQCQCPNCKVTLHASDCAVHSGPAYPAGGCDCGAQQGPVAWMSPSWIDPDTRGWQSDSFESIPIEGWLPLYTTPPQRKPQEFVCSTGLCHYRKPLTDDEIWEIAERSEDNRFSFARAIEAAHGIKE